MGIAGTSGMSPVRTVIMESVELGHSFHEQELVRIHESAYRAMEAKSKGDTLYASLAIYNVIDSALTNNPPIPYVVTKSDIDAFGMTPTQMYEYAARIE